MIQRRPCPHWSSREGHDVSMVVIHADAGKTDEGTLSWLADERSKVSYHYLVGRDGTVYQLVDEEKKAWHAGRSHWHGREIGNSVNPISIGVAFANDGEEAYRDVQVKVAGELVADIMRRYRIPPADVRGHNEVSPGRKTDPYQHFSWAAFFAAIGITR